MKNGYDILQWYYEEAFQKVYQPGEPQYVGWFDKHHQIARFEKLIGIGVKTGQSILDYGCGTGDLLGYLNDKNIMVQYYGLDINTKYLELAKKTYPTNQFYCGDVIDITTDSIQVDWILASGVFNILVPEDWMLFRLQICSKLVKKGFAFNLLKSAEDPEQLRAYNQNYIIEKMHKLFPEFNIELVTGYLDDDFTIYIKRKIPFL